MIHLTMTGYYAGAPLCNCDKQEARQRGDDFTHYVYYHHPLGWDNPELCQECAAVAKRAEDDTFDEINS